MRTLSSVSTQRIATAAATALTLGSVVLGSAAPASAATGKWTQLSTYTSSFPKMSNIDHPTIARFGDSVQVVWPAESSSSTEGYWSAQVNGAGAVSMAAKPIISNWATVTRDPSLVSLNGQRFLGFSGLQSTTTGAPYTSGAEYYATSGDGAAWNVGAGTLSNTKSAYGSYGNDIVDMAGTPVWVGNAGTTTGVRWHVGISPADPAADGDGEHLQSGCCAYYAAGARDAATGAVYAAFYSNSSAANENGIQVGQILPSAGAFTQAPGSTTTSSGSVDSLDPGQRVALASRAGGGVYIAYKVGYPTTKTIRLLHVGTNRTMDVPGSGDASAISLAGGPDGRMWIVWKSHDRLKAVHTNAAVTQFGAVGSWGAPKGTSTLWSTAASAEAGGLDVAVSADVKSATNVWHIQLIRTLAIKSSPGSAGRGASVTFTVSDAGDPVSGAKVAFGGHSGTTNASGKVTLTAPRSSGTARATATKSGYHVGATGVHIH